MSAKNKILVEWSEEDQCYVGSIPDWLGPCCHGNSELETYRELCMVLAGWIEKNKLPGNSDKNLPNLDKAEIMEVASDRLQAAIESLPPKGH